MAGASCGAVLGPVAGLSLLVDFFMSMIDRCFLCWNVRGLNDRAKRDSVKSVVVDLRPSIICLQETKLSIVSDYDILSILGAGFSNFVFKPAQGSRGGC
jgi:exonuclease III